MSARLYQLSPVKREAYRRLRERQRARVVLRAGDGPAGLVLVHPVGGSLGCYLPLLNALPQGLPVIGFAADRLVFDLSIPELAREYLAALGPGDRAWCYAGWSFGGAVAFEMARLAGPRSVAVLLDTDRPTELDGSPAVGEQTVRQFFADDLARLSPEADPLDAELAERFEVYLAYTRALAVYQPGEHSGPTYVVRAARPPGTPIPWHEYCADLTVRDVPGADHYTLLQPPHLQVPVTAIGEALHHV